MTIKEFLKVLPTEKYSEERLKSILDFFLELTDDNFHETCDIYVDDSGDINFDWIPEKGFYLSISTDLSREDNAFVWAYTEPSKKDHGKFLYEGFLSKSIKEILEKFA